MTTDIHKGQCYCGQTRVSVVGPPAIEGYCHCASCQKYHGAPFQAFSAWPNENVTLEGPVITSEKCPQTRRVSCAKCGGVVMTLKPESGMSVVYPATLLSTAHRFLGGVHIHYGERSMDLADGLPKFADVPEDFGGSGIMIAEPHASRWLDKHRELEPGPEGDPK